MGQSSLSDLKFHVQSLYLNDTRFCTKVAFDCSHYLFLALKIITDNLPFSESCTYTKIRQTFSEAARQAVDRSVIVPQNCHYNQNGWPKYDHRVMYKKYTTPLPSYGMWGSRKTS